MTTVSLKIDDDELKVIWGHLVGIIEKFERKAIDIEVRLSISVACRPYDAFLVRLANLDEAGKFANSFEVSALKKILLADATKICDKIQNQIDEQITRQKISYDVVRKKYCVFPKMVAQAPTFSALARAGEALNRSILSLDTTLSNISAVAESADVLFGMHERFLDEIWTCLQDIEKYHNDNGRFNLARNAKALSIFAICLSISFFSIQLFLLWLNTFQTEESLSIQSARTNALLLEILEEMQSP